MKTVDLSCDLGEAASDDELAVEEELWPLITSANIACGGHTGDAETMRRDRDGAALRREGGRSSFLSGPREFGRRTMSIDAADLRESVRTQITALRDVAAEAGVALTHVKPHGALYNDAHADEALAGIVLDAVQSADASLAIVCGEDSAVQREAGRRGVRVIREGFADRRYQSNGALVSRSRRDALLLDPAEAAAQACSIVLDARVTCDDGSQRTLRAETLCIHSDMPSSPERLRAIRAALNDHGVAIRAIQT